MFGTSLILSSCADQHSFTGGGGGGGGASLFDEKDINTFSIAGTAGVITGTNISITVPYGTPLIPIITVSDRASVSPESGVVQTFTSPVVYTVTAEDGTTKDYTVAVTLTTYSLRDTGPAGGSIFYINPNYVNDGWRYLEAASSDQSHLKAWSNLTNWIVGGTGTAIGTGESNSGTIFAQIGHSHIDSAAKLCLDLALGGSSDWFLPSRDELNKLYVNLARGLDEHNVLYTPDSSFNNSSFYWSSSENSGSKAWYQYLNGGYQNAFSKGNLGYVRCVRAF